MTPVSSLPDGWAQRVRGLLLPALAGWLVLAAQLGHAQTVSSVRDNEFRARWADFQVDRAQGPTGLNTVYTDEQPGLLAAFGRSFADYFRLGPLQVRATVASGWEYSDEAVAASENKHPSDSSFFSAPGVGLFYDNQAGGVTISARYSAGYAYYEDRNYIAANDGHGIFSQTAALNLGVQGERVDFTSAFSGAYGNGDDIESGTQRTQLSLSETLTSSYVLTSFTSVGATAGANYADYSGGGVSSIGNLGDSATVYIEYVRSPKTRARFEVSAGQELQTSSGGLGTSNSSADRSYYQFLISADYLPDPKLSLTAGVGYGVQQDADIVGRGQSGSHPIYRITLAYLPTAKTTASLRFGYEGVDVSPSLALEVDWQFRLNTLGTLSVYQQSDFSTYEIAQSLVTRGALASLQQRLFDRVNVSLSAGAEQSLGYKSTVLIQPRPSEDPYYFVGISALYEINSYLAFQTYYRVFTGEGDEAVKQHGIQSRAALSLRLTF